MATCSMTSRRTAPTWQPSKQQSEPRKSPMRHRRDIARNTQEKSNALGGFVNRWSGVQISHPAPARFTYRRDLPLSFTISHDRARARLPASFERSAGPHPDVQEAPVKWAKYPSSPAPWDLVHALRSVAHCGVCNTSEI